MMYNAKINLYFNDIFLNMGSTDSKETSKLN